MTVLPDETARDCPYRGLEPFDERDAPFFFGRERETKLITASLFASPLTLLYGASGVGKSSVLRAGVLPGLRERRALLPVVFPTIRSEPRAAEPAVLRGWQSDPLGGIKETVAVALDRCAGEDSALRKLLQDTVLGHQTAPLREFLLACHQASGRRLMVILDQFEEYSLYHPEDDEFGEQFPFAITPGDLSVSFLVSLREDSLAKLDRFEGRIPGLWDSYRRVDHLDRAAADEAIRRPLDEYNRRRPGSAPITIADDLVNAVLFQVQTESVQFEATGSGTVGSKPGVEGRIETPYLQLVMMRLWEKEQAEGSTALRSSTLQAEGGAAEIVRTHLDRVMEQFTAEERDIAARVFHRLVTPSGAKIAFSVRDLAAYDAIDPELLAPILARLEEGSRRILRRVASRDATRPDAADEPRYEIFHDRLGQAILSWRTKRLQEQEREKRQREEAEQRRIAEQTTSSLRGAVDSAMAQLGSDGQAQWARMMFDLVSPNGARLKQTAAALAEYSQQPRGTVEAVLNRLVDAGVLRAAYKSTSDTDPLYEVSDDAMASALLEWHSLFVAIRTRASSGEPARQREAAEFATTQPAPSRGREFPYRMMRELLHAGNVIPFLGSGASQSATPPVPSVRQMKELMARECAFPASEFEQSDVAEVASFFVQRVGREELDELLHDTFGRQDYTPSQTHLLIAQAATAAPLLILTTNYDTMMEQALEQLGTPYDTVAYARQERGLHVTRYGATEPERVPSNEFVPSRDRTVLYRVNGPAIVQGRVMGTYSITEEDNIDWIVGLYAYTVVPPFVASALQRTPVLSLGHSARDWSQRALLRLLYDQGRARRSSWAVSLNPAPLSVMTWQRYGVQVFNQDLNEWAARMRDAGSA